LNLSWDPKLAPSSLTYLDYRHDVLTRDGATAPDQYKANTLRRERAFLSMMHGTRDHGGLEKGGGPETPHNDIAYACACSAGASHIGW
jgi:hypothetical protein